MRIKFLLSMALATLAYGQFAPQPVKCSNGNCSLPAGSTLTIGARVSASNVATLPTTGLMAEYRFLDGSGTALTDSSGNGRDGTLAASSNAPTWTAAGLSFSYSTNQWVDLPAALNTAVTVVMVVDIPVPASVNNWTSMYQVLFGPSVSGGPALFSYISTASTPAMVSRTRLGFVHSGSFSTSSLDPLSGVHTVTAVLGTNPTTDKIYIDARESSGYGASSFNGGIMSSGNYRLGYGATGLGTASQRFAGTMYYAAFYSTALTAAQVAAVSQYMQATLAARGINAAPAGKTAGFDNRIVYFGDSITIGKSPATPFTSLLALDDTYTVVNLGVAGGYASDAFATVLANLANFSSGSKQICKLGWASNDIDAGATAATTAANIFKAADACRAAGFKVIISTMLSRIGDDTGKNTLNTILRKNWQEHAHGLADWAAHALLGADGAYANGTDFQDNIHPTTAGNTLIAAIESNVANSVYGNTPASGTPNTATGTYTMLGADLYLLADPSGGSVTVNALTAIGLTGQVRCVKNIQTAGGNTVTFAANGSETIDGAASVTIANKATACFRSQLVSAAAGGANWQQVQ